MKNQIILTKILLIIFAALSVFVSIYFIPVFAVLNIYLYKQIYKRDMESLKFKTPEIERLVKLEVIISPIAFISLVSLFAMMNHAVLDRNLVYYSIIFIFLFPMMYIDLKKRHLLALEEIKDNTY